MRLISLEALPRKFLLFFLFIFIINTAKLAHLRVCPSLSGGFNWLPEGVLVQVDTCVRAVPVLFRAPIDGQTRAAISVQLVAVLTRALLHG